MELVWALLKIVEAIMGFVCLIIHVVAITEAEPMHHIVFYCGTFVGFTLTAVYGAICIVIHRGAGVTSEVIINLLGAVMYIIASLWSMYHAERDVHLQFLTDFEEALHPFFLYCRRQSIASLACGSVYIMHCAFAFDMLISKATATDLRDDISEEMPQVLHLYFICPLVHNQLCKYQWFRKYLNILDSGAMNFDTDFSSISLSKVLSSLTFKKDTEKTARFSRYRESLRWSTITDIESPTPET